MESSFHYLMDSSFLSFYYLIKEDSSKRFTSPFFWQPPCNSLSFCGCLMSWNLYWLVHSSHLLIVDHRKERDSLLMVILKEEFIRQGSPLPLFRNFSCSYCQAFAESPINMGLAVSYRTAFSSMFGWSLRSEGKCKCYSFSNMAQDFLWWITLLFSGKSWSVLLVSGPLFL